MYLNYFILFLFIPIVFKLNLFKSFISLILSIFIFGICSTLLLNPYMKFCNINLDTLNAVPIHKLIYTFLLYSTIFIICHLFKHYNLNKIYSLFTETFNSKAKFTLVFNFVLGILVICIQVGLTFYYIDTYSIFFTFVSCISLFAYFFTSFYSLAKASKLEVTTKNLENAEEYNKSLEILYDKVKGFKHDFNNIVSTLDGYIENNDMVGLKDYFEEVKNDCNITNNLSLLNPRVINNPGIYSLLNNKYFKAMDSGVRFDIDFFLDLNKLQINTYEFSRILGILIDNAIEEAEKCNEKIVKISFRREPKNNRSIINIQNTYSNKDVNTEEIFKKGFSGKENHSGIGLWEVKKYISKSKNLDLFTTKTTKFFKQELSIYDI